MPKRIRNISPRKGMGRGKGKGYKNIIGKDPRVHSDSAKGRKQPQVMTSIPNIRKAGRLEQLKLSVMLAYGDDRGLSVRNLDYVSPRVNSIKEAQEMVKLVKSYNNFIGDDVSKAIGKLNQSHIASIQFGRENSPVLYISFPSWDSQAIKPRNRDIHYSTEQKKKFVKEVYDAFSSVNQKPDEFGMTTYGGEIVAWYDDLETYKGDFDGVRLWWD